MKVLHQSNRCPLVVAPIKSMKLIAFFFSTDFIGLVHLKFICDFISDDSLVVECIIVNGLDELLAATASSN